MEKNQLIGLLVASILIGSTGLLGSGVLFLNSQDLNSQLQETTDEYQQLITEYEELNNSYNDLLGQYSTVTNQYNEAMNILNGTIEDCDRLNQSYNNLILEYKSLNSTYYILTGEHLDLNSTYYELIDQRDQLNQTYYSLVADYEILESQNATLTTLYSDLSLNYQMLQNEYDGLLISYNTLQSNYDTLKSDYQNLETDYLILNQSYQTLNQEYSQLSTDYDLLDSEYQSLNSSYYDLQDDYQLLNNSYIILTTWISQQILPVQYCLFAEAVRRYYEPLYLDGVTTKEWYMGAAEFARDMVLHDSNQYNAFNDVSNALSDVLTYGNDTMGLCWQTMWNVFYSWLPNWGGYGLTGNELTDIDTVHQWCVDNIDYEYDSDITLLQEAEFWDYFKFPVETAFRTMGDCEDQAILDAAYLESCGFETAIAIIHDPDHPTYGSFYHATLLVSIEDTATFWSMYPDGVLWIFSNDPDNKYWCWLDPTWDVPFGSTPAWLQGYRDYGGLAFDIMSIAFCDVGGAVG